MIKKRFIAGAKCPRCQAQDRIVMLTTMDDEWIECVDCDYTDRRPTKEQLQTAVSDEVGVIQFRPNSK